MNAGTAATETTRSSDAAGTAVADADAVVGPPLFASSDPPATATADPEAGACEGEGGRAGGATGTSSGDCDATGDDRDDDDDDDGACSGDDRPDPVAAEGEPPSAASERGRAAPAAAWNDVLVRVMSSMSVSPSGGAAGVAGDGDAQDVPPAAEAGGGLRDDGEAGVDSPAVPWGRARKDRPSAVSGDGSEVGAVQVDEQAPQLNRRFFRGLDRRSFRVRNDRARERRRRRRALDEEERRRTGRTEEDDDGDDGGEGRRRASVDAGDAEEARGPPRGSTAATSGRMMRRGSTFGFAAFGSLVAQARRRSSGDGDGEGAPPPPAYRRQNTRGEYLIHAELVVEASSERVGEVVEAEPVGYFARRYKRIGLAVCVSFSVVVLALSVALGMNTVAPVPPSIPPSPPPTFDPRPTLDAVRERGHVRCGVREEKPREGFYLNLCRAVAAVLLGNPESYVPVGVTLGDRFHRLHDRDVDLLLSSDTHTIEREVRENATGSGFTFSAPYDYDGSAYFGEERFVRCAEGERRFGECSSLKICVQDRSILLDFLRRSFPPSFLTVTSSRRDSFERLSDRTCNVLTTDRGYLMELLSDESERDGRVVGDRFLTKDPHAIVTRNADREFSDVVNWAVQALFYGEERGLGKDASRCRTYATLSPSDPSALNFLNAVHCVGNYGEIYPNKETRGMNRINDGTTGMVYATPFGELENPSSDLAVDDTDDNFLEDIRKNQRFNCGVVVPDGFDGNLSESRELIGMSVDYCRGLAAALFNGDSEAVNFTTFSEDDSSSFAALDSGTINVLAGGRIEREYDFGMPQSSRGVQFSTPYYHGNEAASDNVSFFALATREDSPMFSSFVNCVVLATIYAKENDITKKRNKEMPLLSLFGNELRWMLRDSISYLGSYDQISAKHFGGVFNEECDANDNGINKDDFGRNYLNEGGPQIHSFPGLSH